MKESGLNYKTLLHNFFEREFEMSEQNTIPNTAIIESIKNLSLTGIFIVHLIFITWAIQGSWSPNSYFFYNILFLLTVIWSLQNKESEEPVLLCLVINGLAILFDIILLSIYFPSYGNSEKFSGAMAIFNLVLRPISCLSLHKHWRNRVNEPPADFSFAGSCSAKKTKNYEDVESQSYPGIDNLTTPYQ